jgi:hypothetical protein
MIGGFAEIISPDCHNWAESRHNDTGGVLGTDWTDEGRSI